MVQEPSGTDRAAALDAQGLSVSRIAVELGCSRSAVYRRLNRDGVAMRPGIPPMLPASTAEVVRLRDAGMTWARVGTAVG